MGGCMSTTEKPGIRLRFFRNVRSAKWRNPAMKKITVRKAGTVRLTSVSHALYSSCVAK